MKLLVCFGTRPEAIKMAPICMQLKKEGITFKIAVTAQHREMLDQVLDFFELVPDYDLNLMTPNQSLNQLSARILHQMDALFTNESFDMALVHGDTTTSTMVALAAFHKGIKVAHVEAGLRTYNKQSPFPEELNRQLTGKIADVHFAPTEKAATHLIQEGVLPASILITGNTVIDALKITLSKLKHGAISEHILHLKQQLDFSKQIILVTGHRRENFGAGFENLCNALKELAKNKSIEIVYPVHLNPNVKEVVYKMLSNIKNIHLIAPLEYPSFVWLMSASSIIISDSGGIQEEAPSLNVPVIVTRTTTERDEGIQAGCSYLVGTDSDAIVKKATELLQNNLNTLDFINPYGDGKAAEKIVDFIKKINFL